MSNVFYYILAIVIKLKIQDAEYRMQLKLLQQISLGFKKHFNLSKKQKSRAVSPGVAFRASNICGVVTLSIKICYLRIYNYKFKDKFIRNVKFFKRINFFYY